MKYIIEAFDGGEPVGYVKKYEKTGISYTGYEGDAMVFENREEASGLASSLFDAVGLNCILMRAM